MAVADVQDKNKLLKTLKADYSNSKQYHDDWMQKQQQWADEFDGKPYGNEVAGKSTVVSRDIKKTASWQHASILSPFVSDEDIVTAEPVTAEDVTAAYQNEITLNYQFARKFSRFNFISDSIYIGQKRGTVIAKTSWVNNIGTRIVEQPITEKKILVDNYGQVIQKDVIVGYEEIEEEFDIDNRPDTEIRPNSAIYFDPTCNGDVNKANFIIDVFQSSKSELKSIGIYENIDDIKIKNDTDKYEFEDDGSDQKKSFKFDDDARAEFDVYEYWGFISIDGSDELQYVVTTWVGDVLIRYDEDPTPDGKLPFDVWQYEKEPFEIYGNAIAHTIGADQKIKTGIKRAVIDTLSKSANGQRGFPKQMLDPINKKKFESGEDFEYNPDVGVIWEGQFNDVPADVMNFYNMISAEVESIMGVKSFYGGIGSSTMGDSATAARGVLDATAKRESEIVISYRDNFLIPILRKWMALNAEYLNQEEIMRLTGGEYVTVNRDDLQGNIDIKLNVSTPEQNQARSAELSFMLQTLGNKIPFEMTQIILSEITRLKDMPELSKRLKEFKPQPDKLAEQKAMLEIKDLEGKIAERNTRAEENVVDMRLKSAKARSEEAKARETHSKADMQDLDFVRKQTGQNQQEQLVGDIVKKNA